MNKASSSPDRTFSGPDMTLKQPDTSFSGPDIDLKRPDITFSGVNINFKRPDKTLKRVDKNKKLCVDAFVFADFSSKRVFGCLGCSVLHRKSYTTLRNPKDENRDHHKLMKDIFL